MPTQDIHMATGDLGNRDGSKIVEAVVSGIVDKANDIGLDHGAMRPLEFEEHFFLCSCETGGNQRMIGHLCGGGLEVSTMCVLCHYSSSFHLIDNGCSLIKVNCVDVGALSLQQH